MAKLTVEQIARVAHEVNRQYVIGLRDRTLPPTKQIGGAFLPPPPVEPEPPTYDQEAPGTQIGLMDAVHLVLDNPAIAPGELHHKWLMTRQAQGWRYGPKKDPIRMEHPNIAPFDMLSPAEQAKDFIFRAVVSALGTVDVKDAVHMQIHVDPSLAEEKLSEIDPELERRAVINEDFGKDSKG